MKSSGQFFLLYVAFAYSLLNVKTFKKFSSRENKESSNLNIGPLQSLKKTKKNLNIGPSLIIMLNVLIKESIGEANKSLWRGQL
jgi:hypothetical protein